MESIRCVDKMPDRGILVIACAQALNRWIMAKYVTFGHLGVNHEEHLHYWIDGWYEVGQRGDLRKKVSSTVTSWMPMPPSPNE